MYWSRLYLTKGQTNRKIAARSYFWEKVFYLQYIFLSVSNSSKKDRCITLH